MENFLKKLNKTKQEVILPLASQSRIRGNLLQYMRKNPAAITTSSRYKDFKFFGNLFLKPLPAFSAVVLIILALGAGTAFAANGSLPGDILYPVKTNINESIRSAFILNADARANYEMQLANLRLDEANQLEAHNRLDSSTQSRIADNFEQHASRVEDRIKSLGGESNLQAAGDLAGRFENSLWTHQVILTKLKDKNSPALPGKVDDILTNLVITQTELETETTKSDNDNSQSQSGAEGKVDTAFSAINSTEDLFHEANDTGDDASDATAQNQLDIAKNLADRAREKVKSGEFDQAFILGQASLRTAQNAKENLRRNRNGRHGIQKSTNSTNILPPNNAGAPLQNDSGPRNDNSGSPLKINGNLQIPSGDDPRPELEH